VGCPEGEGGKGRSSHPAPTLIVHVKNLYMPHADIRQIQRANKCEKDQSYATAREEGQEVENNGRW